MGTHKNILYNNYNAFIIISSCILFIPVLLHLVGALPNTIFINRELHTAIEAIGAIMNILITVLIYVRFKDDKTELYYPFIGLSFLSMGIFDLTHSFTQTNNTFILSHVTSVLSGGFWFGIIIMPDNIKLMIRKPLVFKFLIMLWGSIVIYMLFFPEYLPSINKNNHLAQWMLIVNMLAGVGFLTGVYCLVRRFKKTKENELFNIAIVGLIHGLSRFTFNLSNLWDIEWWIWHIFRLAGSIVIIFTILKLFQHMIADLKQANNDQEAIIASMPFGLIVTDSNKTIRHLNPMAEELTGYTKSEISGKSCHNYLCDCNEGQCPIVDLNHDINNQEKLMGRKYGPKFPVLKSVVPISLNNESLFLEGFVDLTEMHKAQHQLKINEKKFRDIFDAVNYSIFIIDPEKGIVEVNKKATEQYGYSKEEFLKMTPRDFIHPDYLYEYTRFLNELKAKGHFKGSTIDLRKDGSGFYTEVTGTIVSFNGVPHILGAVQDITEIKETEIKLTNALKELQKTNKEMEQYTFVSSHDLQEPLRKVKNYSELLSNKYQHTLENDGKKYIEVIKSSIGRMQQLVNDLLAMADIRNSDKRFENTDTSEMVRNAIETYEDLIKSCNAQIIYKGLPIINGIKGQIYILFQNLLGNALKYRKADISPKIEINFKDLETHWEFSFSDNGIGFDMEYTDKIFNLFQRLHSKEEYEGTGIGLTLCKKIIEGHKGNIWAQSNPGKGTTFYFTIMKNLKQKEHDDN